MLENQEVVLCFFLLILVSIVFPILIMMPSEVAIIPDQRNRLEWVLSRNFKIAVKTRQEMPVTKQSVSKEKASGSVCFMIVDLGQGTVIHHVIGEPDGVIFNVYYLTLILINKKE